MYKKLLRLGICAALALAGTGAMAACYNVYNSRGQLVERDANPPVNMSKHLRYTVPAKYGKGATMVFEAPVGSSCDGFTVKRAAQSRTTQNTDELLDNLARQYDWSRPSNQYRRSDGWIADVEF